MGKFMSQPSSKNGILPLGDSWRYGPIGVREWCGKAGLGKKETLTQSLFPRG